MEDRGWKQLAVPYFRETVRRSFDAWFSDRGARVVREIPDGGIWYQTESGVITEITYYWEDSPNYSPMVNVGTMVGKVFEMVGLWALIPDDRPESAYYRWTFSNAEQLEASLSRIRDELFPQYVEPLLNDRDAVLSIIERREKK